MEILYQDNSIIVCIKPAGIISQESPERNMPELISEETGIKTFPVHRLDRETTGIMVFACTEKAAALLSDQIRTGTMKKKYLALVDGILEEKTGTMEDFVFHDRQKNKTFVVKKERKGVKKASLEYSVVKELSGRSIVDILLHTGRTHQIRVQFGSRRHPLTGDGKYGGEKGKIQLFAYNLVFTHPDTGKMLEFDKKDEFLNILEDEVN